MLAHSIGLSGELLLRSPISLWIEEDEGQALAEAPEFHIVGEGATEPEAITDAMIQLKDLYDDLMDTPDENLGALPKRWKRVLKNLVIDHARNFNSSEADRGFGKLQSLNQADPDNGLSLRSGKEHFGWYLVYGKKGPSSIGKGRARQLAQYLHLTIGEFGELCDCTLTGPEYHSRIVEKVSRGTL